MLNEFLWSAGLSFAASCFSLRGLQVVAAMNISSSISNLFNTVFLNLGSAISILIGQRMGAGQMEEAETEDRQLIALSVLVSIICAACMALLAPWLISCFHAEVSVSAQSLCFVYISCVLIWINAFNNAAYFTIC